MSGFLVFSFIVSPTVSYLTNPSRRWNRYRKSTGRDMALILLLVIALANSLKVDPNYFQMLKVDPHSSVEQIKKSFKQEAFHSHPDRNSSPKASEEYIELARIYKLLVNSKSRENYNRYGDIVSDQSDRTKQIGPAEVMYVVFITSATSLFGALLVIMLYGGHALSVPAMLYELFCLLLDIYLRFSPDATTLMKGIPVMHSYTIFEIIAFFRNFRVFFMYSSSILGKTVEEDGNSWKAATGLVKNNLLLIMNLDACLGAIRSTFTALPVASGDSHDPGSKCEIQTAPKQPMPSDNNTSTDTVALSSSLDEGKSTRTKWDKTYIKSLLNQANAAMSTSTSPVRLLLYVLPWAASMFM